MAIVCTLLLGLTGLLSLMFAPLVQADIVHSILARRNPLACAVLRNVERDIFVPSSVFQTKVDPVLFAEHIAIFQFAINGREVRPVVRQVGHPDGVIQGNSYGSVGSENRGVNNFCSRLGSNWRRVIETWESVVLRKFGGICKDDLQSNFTPEHLNWRSPSVLYLDGSFHVTAKLSPNFKFREGSIGWGNRQPSPLFQVTRISRSYQCFFGGSRRAFGSLGRNSSGYPLASSEFSVGSDDDKGEDGNEECDPVRSHPNAKSSPYPLVFALSILLFGYGLWFIQSAGLVKNISAINISKVVSGLIFILAGWATLHAALDLRDCGRVYLDHLWP
jgi:hypothetical protein